MDIQPIYGVPALRADNIAVITDLHIGLETHLVSKGFHIETRTENMFDTIMELDDDISRLVVIGDIKDSVPGSNRQEYREIPEFFERLLQRFDIVDVVRGNHDTNIEEFLPSRVRIAPASGLLIDDVGFIHGHTWPSDKVMNCNTLVMGHNHPTVMFMDGIGRTFTEPCWVRGPFKGKSEKYPVIPKNYVIVPAFNRMLGGSPVNIEGGTLLGPLMNSDLADLNNATIHLLDGIDLGTMSNIIVKDKVVSKKYARNKPY